MTSVLVVDDEINTLDVFRLFLELSGYHAFTSLDSQDAVSIAEREHPDCVVLDVMMPNLDGFEVSKLLRRNPTTADLPILFCTAYSAVDMEERRRDAGADMVVMKPLGMENLTQAINKTIAVRPEKTAQQMRPVPPQRTKHAVKSRRIKQTAYLGNTSVSLDSTATTE